MMCALPLGAQEEMAQQFTVPESPPSMIGTLKHRWDQILEDDYFDVNPEGNYDMALERSTRADIHIIVLDLIKEKEAA
jgi:hypothetical protein